MNEILIKVIKDTGQFIKKRFDEKYNVQSKDSINNIVTEVDLQAEQLIKRYIKSEYPNHGFIGEEYGIEVPDATFKWIIDPIDGTVNFANRLPLYCVSIALSKDDDVILGAVYNPVLDELFYAEKGKGAFCNNNRMQVSTNVDLSTSFLVTGFPYHFPKEKKITDIFVNVVTQGIPLRRLGSAALDLAYVADGRFDGFWEWNLSPWDIAAGYLLVEEAGGTVTDFSNIKGHFSHKETLATNGKIHTQLLNEIQKI